jgi:dihydrofolate reductase
MSTAPPARTNAAADAGGLAPWALHGYAIVSDEGMIADARGAMPAALVNEADWAYFQAELDRADLVLVGQRSHEAAPNTRRRRRLVVSSSAAALEQRPDAWWWNPQALSLRAVLERLLPAGGRVAVPGGQGVFDLVAGERAFAEFHLCHAVGVKLPEGHPAFSAIARGATVSSVLAAAGLAPGPTQTIDPAVPVTLTVWRRA